MNVRLAVLVLALAGSTTGCQLSQEVMAPAPGGDGGREEHGAVTGTPAITTDASSYVLEPEWVGLRTSIGIRFLNRSAETMYIVNCRGGLAATLQKRVGGEWVTYWSPVLQQCLSAPIVVAPGATFEQQLNVWGALPGSNALPQWASADVAGTYRLVLGNLVWNYDDRRHGFGDKVPLELRTSNEFVLRR
jgi:hypothetical protein